MDKGEIANWFQALQDRICKGLEYADGKAIFKEDKWEREGGGGGRTRVIQNGNIFEKGGVNFSAVHGILEGAAAVAILQSKTAQPFFASGVSIVIHPRSPMVPIIHMNVRYFEAGNQQWFGGGIDLTPIYIVEGDARYFHIELKKVCDLFSPYYYPDFKKWADDYFYIKHRNETRGIGGIFFDKLVQNETTSIENIFEFVKAVGNIFLPIYSNIVRINKDKKFTEKEKDWQLLRRGRYVEFNLVNDSGTKFGLETNGRTESILMSLPPQASWAYDFIPENKSEEEKTLAFLKKGIDWKNK